MFLPAPPKLMAFPQQDLLGVCCLPDVLLGATKELTEGAR